MSRTIYKYPIEVTDEQTIYMHKDADILCVQMQHGRPCIWAMVDRDTSPDPHRFEVYGTGHTIREPEGLTYIGTFQVRDGALVFHLFERKE